MQKIHTHNLTDLVRLAELQNDCDRLKSENRLFLEKWLIASKWEAEARYITWKENDAKALINAVVDPINGVIQWVKKHY